MFETGDTIHKNQALDTRYDIKKYCNQNLEASKLVRNMDIVNQKIHTREQN